MKLARLSSPGLSYSASHIVCCWVTALVSQLTSSLRALRLVELPSTRRPLIRALCGTAVRSSSRSANALSRLFPPSSSSTLALFPRWVEKTEFFVFFPGSR
jgi:hypothetical protein